MATASKSGGKPVKTPGKPKSAKTATAVKVPAAKKLAAAKKTTTKATAPASKAARATAASQPAAMPVLTPEQRCHYVEVAAYYIAERRGFHGGSQMEDWVQAEKEIDRLLREGILKP